MMEHISFANAYIDVYQTINNARVKYNEKVNYAPGFFSVTIMALTNSIFMETGKLVDPHREAFSFYKLINLCKDNQDVFFDQGDNNFDMKNEIIKTEKLLSELQPTIISLKTQRDNIYAHYDKKYFLDYSELLQIHPVSILDFMKILNCMASFCNLVLGILGNTYTIPRHTNNQDLINLLMKIE